MAIGQGYILGTESQLHWALYTGGVLGGFTNVGNVLDGVMNEDSEAREIRSVGSYIPVAIREGLIRCFGNCRFILKDVGFLGNVIRSGGRLPQLAFAAGQPANITEYVTHQYCKLDSVNIECTAGGEVVCTVDWKGLTFAVNATALGNLGQGSNKAMMWYGAGFSDDSAFGSQRYAGDGLQPVSISIRIENNTDWLPVIDNTLSVGRAAKYIREGMQRVTFGMRVLIPESFDLQQANINYISSVALQFYNSDPANPHTVTLTLYDLMRGGRERPLRPEDIATHGVTYAARDIAISAT